MKVAFWAEIHRLAEIEKLSCRAISRRLHCSRHLVTLALKLDRPPTRRVSRGVSILDPYKTKIGALLSKNPDLSGERIREEIARGPDGYQGSAIVVRGNLTKSWPRRGEPEILCRAETRSVCGSAACSIGTRSESTSN
jgi:hypothetical protein